MSPYLISQSDFPSDVLVMGGSAFEMLQGVRLYTDSCAPVAYIGEDFDDIYEEWLLRHSVSKEFLVPRDNPCPRLTMQTDGGSFTIPEKDILPSFYPDLRLIGNAVDFDVKGVCLSTPCCDVDFWLNMYDQKGRYGFRLAWEFSESDDNSQIDTSALQQILSYCDLWSVSIQKAACIFNIPVLETDIIARHIAGISHSLTLLHCGEQGCIVISPDTTVRIPVIKLPEHRGRSQGFSVSTGAALYALCEGFLPAMIGIFANTAQGYYNCQTGPIDPISYEVMREALNRVYEEYANSAGSRRKIAVEQ